MAGGGLEVRGAYQTLGMPEGVIAAAAIILQDFLDARKGSGDLDADAELPDE